MNEESSRVNVVVINSNTSHIVRSDSIVIASLDIIRGFKGGEINDSIQIA